LKPSTPRPGSGRPGHEPQPERQTAAPKVVSLLTDYGLADGFVGALHSVLRARLPCIPIVDLTHEVRRQDVRAGSLALRRAAPYLAEGVVVAVVDPGVGTQRRAIAVRAAAADVTFVGPDNGLMLPALDVLGGPALAVVLENPAYQLTAPGPTFAGRDVFAPAAAHLAGGGELGELGPPVGSHTLVRLPAPVCREGTGGLEAEVTWVDHYGNVQLAAGAAAVEGRARLRVTRAGKAGRAAGEMAGDRRAPGEPGRPGGAGRPAPSWPVRVAHTFADLAPGELGILIDSYGSLALCLNGASAAERLGANEGDILLLTHPV
jgi:S-adenosyl-L-methionine hydrolase (adenosine-forming)